jgi:hypothetical protein
MTQFIKKPRIRNGVNVETMLATRAAISAQRERAMLQFLFGTTAL